MILDTEAVRPTLCVWQLFDFMAEGGKFMFESTQPGAQMHDELHVQYSIDFTRTMTALEKQLHSCEDPSVIAMDALKVGAAFYDADWCGVIEGDLEMEAWAPVLWYNVANHGMTETAFRDLEETKNLERWVEKLYACEPLIIPDTLEIQESNPEEYALYERCKAKAILAVPFWKNPTGFMIVRNPKRYHIDPYESGFLQALAFVTFNAITEQKLINRTQKAFSPDSIKNDNDVMVNLFGKLEIYTSKGVITEEEISSPRISRFLVYMLLHGKYPVPPRTILEQIWPDEDAESASTKIKSLAYRLQTVFGVVSDSRLIISTLRGYQLNPDLNIMTDIQEFEDCWRKAQSAITMQAKLELLKKATEIYDGNIYDTASSEHWLMPYELTYKYKCLEIYIDMVRIYFDVQDYANAQKYASLALLIDKANVDAYYWLIRAKRQKDSLSMAKGELKLAEHVLSTEEYAELLQKLENTKDLEI